tara:strand:+ start:124 stop:1194 length:1071 start_codon:yes stop_codon:yes gene_type:complete
MANSTSASLKLTVQATGENSGTWGQITNTNLLILEQAIGGFQSVAITTGATLTFSNGALSNGKNQVLKLVGTIGGAVNVVVPDSVEKTYIIDNATTGAYTVTVKTSSGTGVTWAAADKGTKMVYSDGTNVVDTAFTDLSSDFSPQLSADLDTNAQNIIIDNTKAILDESSNEQIKFSTTGSAVNEFTVANAATGNGPILSATGGDTNIDLNITPKGYGRATFNGQGKIQSVAEKVTTEATAATGTINYDVLTQAVWNFTTNAAANWTLNIRGDGSTSLDSIMDTGESITIAHIVKQGSTPYYNSAVQIDGSSVTPEYQGGSAPSAGNASSLDVYTYTIIKTGSATFTVLAAQTQFA